MGENTSKSAFVKGMCEFEAKYEVEELRFILATSTHH